jgi:hypothetical protein
MQDFEAMIREAIRRDKRTLYRIAKDADLSYATIHRFYNAKRVRLTLPVAARLCDVLGLTLVKRKRKG